MRCLAVFLVVLGLSEALLNSLTKEEVESGWELLFDGHSFNGWHNFKEDGVQKGWIVQDGTMVCADPHNAGDLVTLKQFSWFELKMEYNISYAGNSGVMYHVTNDGDHVWETGPEFQLEDNAHAEDPQRCGWLYALYQPPIDPTTNMTLDATKPAGEWNEIKLVVKPDECFHEVNGVKYFSYVLGSDDFNARVDQSKFASMPYFAKSNTGFIALQGDHGSVSFRNIKIRSFS
jgi:hypothetical protein